MNYSEMPLPGDVEYIINKLTENGYRADVVGGAVRDFLLGKVPHDYDITTSADPNEVKAVFKDLKTVDTGIKHGTVTLVLNNKPYEITTYRHEEGYTDSRHPDKVVFTRRIEDDLSRRDFTVNAMAYSKANGVCDLFGGISDLEKRIIRTVGNARERFTEDALRILRALRFASLLDFEIEDSTSSAMSALAHKLSLISAERIYSEWKKLLAGKGAYRIASQYQDIVRTVIPALHLPDRLNMDIFERADPVLRFAALIFSADENECQKTLDILRVDNKTKNLIMTLISNADISLQNKTEMKRALSRIGEENTKSLIEFRELICFGKGEKAVLDLVLSSGECYKLSDLKVKGGDLITLLGAGKKTGEVLSALLNAVIDGELENEKGTLLSAAVKMLK